VFGNGQILGCQSEAANPLSRSWSAVCETDGPSCGTRIEQHIKWKNIYKPIKAGETTATAALIGKPVSWEKVMMSVMESCGAMVTAKEHDLNEAVSVCGRDGIFVCPQTGIALAGIREAVRKGWLKPGNTVVAVSTATGLKFTESASKGLEKEIIDAPSCDTDTVAKLMGL
jgi:threonine synthase